MAKEYIEREAVLKELDDLISNIAFSSPYQDDINVMVCGMERARDCVEEAPATDVVEVVRCKDCVYRHLTGKAPFMFYTCTIAEGLNVCKDNAFCSYGERRTDDGNKENL